MTKESAVKGYDYTYEDSLAFRKRPIGMRRAAYALCHRVATIFHGIA